MGGMGGGRDPQWGTHNGLKCRNTQEKGPHTTTFLEGGPVFKRYQPGLCQNCGIITIRHSGRRISMGLALNPNESSASLCVQTRHALSAQSSANFMRRWHQCLFNV